MAKKNILMRFGLIFCLVVTVTSVIWAELDSPLIGIDDANIFFVYAKHLIHGQGFVYNIGGERVEGFSSFLWTLIAAALFGISEQPELALLLINVLLVTLTITLTTNYLDFQIARRQNAQKGWQFSFYSLLYMFVLCLSPAYFIWQILTLMDNGLWGAVLTATAITTISYQKQRPILLATLIALLLLTRPEAMLWGLVFIGILFFREVYTSNIREGIAAIRLPLLTYFVTLLALTGFRMVYFGYPLPNTYYAKISPSIIYNISEGWRYAVGFFDSAPVVQFSMLILVFSLGLNGQRIFRSVFSHDRTFSVKAVDLFPIVICTGLIIPIITGGDHFNLWRFYQPIYPLLLLNMFIFAANLAETVLAFQWREPLSGMRKWLSVLTICIFLYLIQPLKWENVKESGTIDYEFTLAEDGRYMGRFFSAFFAEVPPPSIGVIVAGGVKMTYEGEIIDLMGLNSVKMGHSQGKRMGMKNHTAFEKTVFYELQPDVMNPFFSFAPVTKCLSEENVKYFYSTLLNHQAMKNWLNGLLSDADFLKKYHFVQIANKKFTTNQCFIGFASGKFLSNLNANASYVINDMNSDSSK
ncbi:hypothetical protein U14_00813 [Candidatus Moduliflexus flocculans]|uniref:Uncharacterized protein n=1 Tax=Candidatus Moduliflexus flocculans TaxID=1499966 RepID=A0A0S6VWP4_9BACT|nr:hypothetical protein U14_00813 [Candidatus Moduliflexus flocculans]